MVTVGGDGVMFAKNSDRDANESQVLEWHPAAVHADGTELQCTWTRIAQAPRTRAVLLSRPWWIWGAEMGANDAGVVIGNEAVFTTSHEDGAGLIGMDLVRLALERADDAEGAVEVIVTLLERHGQGGPCSHEHPRFSYDNSFLVADPEGAIVVETAGRSWATERVARPGRSISNGLTIPGFASAHGDRLRTAASSCVARRARTTDALGATAGPRDLAAALRDHGAGAGRRPRYSPLNGAMSAPCVHAGGSVANSQTTGSWISDLRGPAPRHWATATAAPCTAIFLPVRVDEPLDVGPTPTNRVDDHSIWWAHERLHRRVDRDPEALLGRYVAERDATERDWFASPPPGAEALGHSVTLRRRWTDDVLAGPDTDRRPPWVRLYWARQDRLAGISPAVGAVR